MSTLTDKINSAQYIYSTQTKWGLKRYVCDVSYFKEAPLDDLSLVICSILAAKEDGHYDKQSLGVLLGFSVVNIVTETYYDVAEYRVFEDLLSLVESEHLIRVDNYDIYLTKLGRISVKEGKHYQFFLGTQDVYEHSMLKSETPTALLMFPYYKDMGIWTPLCEKQQIWPEDTDVEAIIYNHTDQLKKRLDLVSKDSVHIYRAVLQEYFDLIAEDVLVKLYMADNEYIPVIMNKESIAIKATELINNNLNIIKKENIVLECLFQKLWDDKSVIFDYETLVPYTELIDFEELTKDSRTKWNDRRLYDLIVKHATATCWKNISRNCDINIIYTQLDEYIDSLDWATLSSRADDNFLIENFVQYPWDLEVIVGDVHRENSVIESLVVISKRTTEEWNWDILKTRLSDDFILEHLPILDIDLSNYTKETKEIEKLILQNLDKKWDWNKIETDFSLDYIYNNIEYLGSYFSLGILCDRIFSDSKWADKFASNGSFQNTIMDASKQNGVLSSSIFNDKKYLWTDNVIDLFLRANLICWSSSPYMVGFEYNSELTWSKNFFTKYSSYIITSEGKSFISKRIIDIDILIENSSFEWDWNAISQNEYLLSDIQLYKTFGIRLNWCSVFGNQADINLLESIIGIDTMIGDDKAAWSAFSAIANIRYVIDRFRWPWNWSVLTARMFESLKLENLGHKDFIDKWDWKYLSENIQIDFLLSNLDKYKNYWDWTICLPRVLTGIRRTDFNFLDSLANTLANLQNSEKCKIVWTIFTAQYSFKELKTLIETTTSKKTYLWDKKYFCQHPDFYIFRDLDTCRNIIDWDALSSSEFVDASLKYNAKIGIKEHAWRDEVKKLFSDSRNHWNYALVSHFKSLKDEKWFISQYKQEIDWDYISRESAIFCEKSKQNLNDIIQEFNEFISYENLSERTDVNIEQIIKINPQANYNYNILIERNIIKATFELVEEKSNYQWNWNLVSSKKSFIPNVDFLTSHISCDINWKVLSQQENKRVWSNEKFLKEIASNEVICDQIDWQRLSTQQYFPIHKEILNTLPLNKLNWKVISEREEIISYIDDYTEYLNWRTLSANKNLSVTDIEILYSYKDYLDWYIVCNREDFVFSNDIIEKFADYIDWNKASSSLQIAFTKQFVEKYLDKWDWAILVKNKAFNNKVDIATMPYAKQINIVEFIKKFPYKPKAYHFTHMENAVKIIRTMKLQSRNLADGNFSNSAGTNVHRTKKAHKFARFYFTPKSPTQFYNECLGKDKGNKYYSKALELGLPKCPLPVFFIFDIEEILSVMPDKCYYSNGNMQKDSSKYFKITENPDQIKAKEIYIDSDNTFNERQQEFLVEEELDFSKLNDVQICCYNSDQEQMLKKELQGTKWEDFVTTNPRLYVRSNKQLYFTESLDSIIIRTDYIGPFEFKVKYYGEKVPNILNKDCILRQRNKDIFVSSEISIKKDCNFEVYFEVTTPRIGSWLIYKI